MKLSMLTRNQIIVAAGIIVTGAFAATYNLWGPSMSEWIDTMTAAIREKPAAEHGDHPDDAHSTADRGSAEIASLELSATAKLNLGLTDEFLKPLQLSTYRRSIPVPAVVVTRPGRTQIHVSAPLTGVVTHVHAVTGETVTPGTLLFEIRLTHEELVTAQTAFLSALGELDVENREVVRLEGLASTGAIPGRSLLDRRYAKERLEATISAQREALKLHGLSDRQVDDIAKERRLLRELQIVAPNVDEHSETEELRLSGSGHLPVSIIKATSSESAINRPLVIQSLVVHKGQAVTAGERLCSLADYTRLFIEGQAFEQDAAAVSMAAEHEWPVTAAFPSPEGETIVDQLQLAFVSNEVDPVTRTLSFFVELANEVIRDTENSEGQRFVSWKYRPGQRLQLRVPVQIWNDQIVVPVDAVVQEGADWFVFQQNGRNFDRIPVHVKFRDQSSVVISNDGSVYPGDVIALRSAHQMQMALKNKSGTGPDPHAGHNH